MLDTLRSWINNAACCITEKTTPPATAAEVDTAEIDAIKAEQLRAWYAEQEAAINHDWQPGEIARIDRSIFGPRLAIIVAVNSNEKVALVNIDPGVSSATWSVDFKDMRPYEPEKETDQ